MTVGVGGWDNDRFHDGGYGYRRHFHHGYVAPGVTFSFGAPAYSYYHPRYYRHRDCRYNWRGDLICGY